MPHANEVKEGAPGGGGADDDANGDRPTQIPRENKDQGSRVRPSAERTQPAPRDGAPDRRDESAFVARLGSFALVPVMRVERETLNGTVMLGEDAVAILLDRIDGISSIEMLLEELPLPRDQALRIMCTLRDEHLIELL